MARAGVRRMAGWSAIAGTNDFLVPDEEHAQSLAEALTTYGFALVTARPDRLGDDWRVTAFDEGPYPTGFAGNRMIDGVARQAAVVARAHAGYPAGGTRCEP